MQMNEPLVPHPSLISSEGWDTTKLNNLCLESEFLYIRIKIFLRYIQKSITQ